MAIGTPVLLKENAVNASGQASIALVLTAGASVGDLVIVSLGYGKASNPSSFTVTDTGGNTWQLDRRDDKTTSNTPHTAIFSAILTTALSAGDTITVTPDVTINYPIGAAYRVSGIAGASWLDQAAGSQGVSASPSSGNVTTAQADELLWGVVCSGAPQAFTPGSGWTEVTDTGNTTKRLAIQYQIVSATGTYTSDGTLAASADWTDSIATYKADVPPTGRLVGAVRAARARAAELRRRRGWTLARRAPAEAPPAVTGLTNTFEGGTDGTAITTGNSGGASGDAFDSVSGGGIVEFDDDVVHEGGVSGRFNANGSASIFVAWTSSLGTLTDHYGRAYLRKAGNPSSNTPFWQFRDTGGNVLQLQLTSGGNVRVLDANGTLVATSSVALANGTWYRLEWHLDHTGGAYELRIFTGDSTSPDETLSDGSGVDMNADCTVIRMGMPASGTNWGSNDLNLDALVAGADTWPGPVGGGGPAPDLQPVDLVTVQAAIARASRW